MRLIAYGLTLWLGVTFVLGEETIAVDVGVDTTAPGATTFLPVTLSGSQALPVTKILLELSFPSEALSFTKVEASANQSAEVQIKTELGQSKADDESREMVLQVDISAPHSIRQGEVLRLGFAVSEQAELYKVLKIRNVKQTVVSAEGQELETVGVDGVITVFPEGSSTFACFFYMH